MSATESITGSKQFLLDTSALIAYLEDEKGASAVVEAKDHSAIPFIAISELYYIFWTRRGETEAEKAYAVVKSWGLPLLLPSETVLLQAGRLKVVYRLGIADSYIAAFALEERLILLTKDTDFKSLHKEISLKLL